MNKFKKAGCRKCNNRGYELRDKGWGDYVAYDKIRCECSLRKTKRYKATLSDKEVSVNEYEQLLNNFVDNNSDCNTKYYD